MTAEDLKPKEGKETVTAVADSGIDSAGIQSQFNLKEDLNSLLKIARSGFNRTELGDQLDLSLDVYGHDALAVSPAKVALDSSPTPANANLQEYWKNFNKNLADLQIIPPLALDMQSGFRDRTYGLKDRTPGLKETADVVRLLPSGAVDNMREKVFGNIIKRDGSEQNYTVKKGDTLSDIALKHMGPFPPGISREERLKAIDAHVKQIAEANGIKDPNKISEGARITLPEYKHGKDQSGQEKNRDGKVDNAPGPVEKVEPRKDQRAENIPPVVKPEPAPVGDKDPKPDPKKMAEEVEKLHKAANPHIFGWGTDEEGMFKALEGKTEAERKMMDDMYKEKYGKSIEKELRDEMGGSDLKKGLELLNKKDKVKDVEAEKKTVTDWAEYKIKDPKELAKFKADMEAFEKRAKEQGLPPEEVATTYRQMSRLLSAKDGVVSPEERVKLAEQIIHHAADPKNIDQGSYNTCNVTTLGERTMTKNPSAAAEMIASTALTGEYKAPDGKVIKIDKESLVPTQEGRLNPPGDGKRSHATQIMNLVMVNDATQRRNPPEIYAQKTKDLKEGDNGERLYKADGKTEVTRKVEKEVTDPVTGEKKKVKVDEPWRQPSLSCKEIVEVGERVTGERPPLISHEKTDNSDKLVVIRSEQEMAKKLKELKEQGKLPAIIMVDANHPMFGGSGKEQDAGSWHVVSVTGYDEKTGKVEISNQWGSKNDKTVDIKDLYEATRRYVAPPKVDQGSTRNLQFDRQNGTENLKIDNKLDFIQKDVEFDRRYRDGKPIPKEEWQL